MKPMFMNLRDEGSQMRTKKCLNTQKWKSIDMFPILKKKITSFLNRSKEIFPVYYKRAL